MRKNWLFIICLGIMLFFLTYTGFTRSHYYFNGKVNAISKNYDYINVSGEDFYIAQDCRVAIHKEVNGAFFENPASLRDIKIGDWVTIKVIDNLVTEILIERYKK